MVKVFSILFLSFVCGVISGPVAATVVYRVQRTGDEPGRFSVQVNLASNRDLTLSLRGASFQPGQFSQVSNAQCDNIPLVQLKKDVSWRVPKGCRSLSWDIYLSPIGSVDASQQMSIGGNVETFTLLSETTSFPRLKPANGEELIHIVEGKDRLVLPATAIERNNAATFALPSSDEAPLFLLFNSTPLGHDAIIHDFVDDPKQALIVPSISSLDQGAAWLRSVISPSRPAPINLVWLKLPANARNDGGATGNDLVLVNYRENAPASNRAVAIALIEIAHRLMGGHPGERPAWFSESLAHYLGLSATRTALPNDPEAVHFLDQFRAEGEKSSHSLSEISKRVASGDGAIYDEFFTKGIAFWSAVDESEGKAGKAQLLSRIPALLDATFATGHNLSPEFPGILGLSDSQWRELKDRFFGPGE
jgi:hypothetical protein